MRLQALDKWSDHILMATPLPFLVPMVYAGNKPAICAYVMLWMAIYWATAVIPLPVTSLLPLVLFPLLGILSTEETASAYFDEVGATIFASMVFGLALERTGLATRVALRMLYVVGTSFPSLLFVFMVGTALLSMLFSNTATTAIVAPVVAALIEQMKHQTRFKRQFRTLSESGVSSIVSPSRPTADVYRKAEEKLRASLVGLGHDSLVKLRREMMVSVAYASSIGGTGALTGTPSNSMLRQLYEKRFPSAPKLTPVTWMSVNVPTMITCLVGAWLCSYWRLKHITYDKAEQSETTQRKAQQEVERRNEELGRIGGAELVVALLLVVLVYLWFFKSRDSTFGWVGLLPSDAKPGAATTLLMVVIPMFAIPGSQQHSAGHHQLRPYEPILTWHAMARTCHWNLVFVISGSLTFSKASQASGLSDVIEEGFLLLGGLHETLTMAILCLFGVAMTQLMTNAGVAAMLTPVVLETAAKLRVHPMSLAMPFTLSCSFAFMLPASTSPNAIVYSMAGMGVRDMAEPGFLLALICVTVTILLTLTWGRFLLQLGEFPEWAADNATTTTRLSGLYN